MDLEGSQLPNGPRWAWARTGALVLFLVTAILLLTALNTARSQLAPTQAVARTERL
jgi:hypothetical protein